ncbi:GAF domain-containing protein [Conyzicola sp.]|uniref:GAF domain-containing protein n=1 Tax=Conyzicola sp. TaxID=1969404 RepID=UPI003988CD79
MKFWLTSTAMSRALIPRPEHADAVHTPGNNPLKVLLVGSGASIGFGVLSHDLALAGHLGRQLSAIMGRAMDIDVAVDREMTSATAPAAIAAQPVARYDAVVVALGLIESLTFTSVQTWRVELTAIIDQLTTSGSSNVQIFIVAVPPLPALMRYPRFIRALSGKHARTLNDASRQLSEHFEHVTYLPFEATGGDETDRFRSSATYSVWAALLSEPIAARLRYAGVRGEPAPAQPVDEAARQSTLESLKILDSEPEERFDRITRTARDLLGTAAAAITIIDRERHWFKSRIGVEKDQMPRFSTLCDITIQGREHFAIEDATQDPRFADNPMVLSEPFLRFYAGYPIEAPNGVRVGTLSVFDPQPRGFSDADAALLRGLALMVQNELRSPPP